MWLAKLSALDMIPWGWLGCKTSPQTTQTKTVIVRFSWNFTEIISLISACDVKVFPCRVICPSYVSLPVWVCDANCLNTLFNFHETSQKWSTWCVTACDINVALLGTYFHCPWYLNLHIQFATCTPCFNPFVRLSWNFIKIGMIGSITWHKDRLQGHLCCALKSVES